MARQPRVASIFLHVIARGIGRQILFEDDSDRRKYLTIIEECRDDTGVTILAYCLMSNHVHLLVKDEEGRVSLFMKKVGVRYAWYFNRKYDRVGHLFQDRFKSAPIKNDEHLLAVFRYILSNPVEAGIAGAADYPWSSYAEYGRAGQLTDTQIFLDLLGDAEAFAAFVAQFDGAEYMDYQRPKHDDEWASEVIARTLGISNAMALQEYAKPERDDALATLKACGLSVRQLERLTGINRGVIQRAKTGRPTVPNGSR